jgi:hypothetical protein
VKWPDGTKSLGQFLVGRHFYRVNATMTLALEAA